MRDYFSDRVLFTEFFKSHFNSLTYLWFSKIVFKHKFLKILQKSVWAFEPIRARGFRYQNLLSVKLKELKCPINLVKSAKLYLLSNSYNRKLKMKNPSFGYAWNRRVKQFLFAYFKYKLTVCETLENTLSQKGSL